MARPSLLRQEHRAIRVVAYFEAFKGVLVVVAASGLAAFIHRDLPGLAAMLIEHAHLNPASHYPRIFIDAASRLQDTRLVLLAVGAAAYATVRLIEAYGLYRERAWAEVFAAASGAVYMPIELYEWVVQPSWLRAVIFLINAAVVGVMLDAIRRRHRATNR